MDILSFSKITKPIYEGGTSIDCRPRGKWLIEVRRTDGTIRRPFGDQWIDNLFINRFVDGQLGSGIPNNSPGGFSNMVGQAAWWSFLSYYYGDRSTIAIGSGTTPVQNSDTALANLVRFDSTAYVTGNSITWNQTSGDIVYTIKEQYPAETGSVTYNEAGIRLSTTGSGWDALNNLVANSNGLVNRVVFPGNVNLVSGEQMIITIAITMPTLGSSAGKTITIGAQNGVNISGVIKCIGSQSSMVGGTVTANGIITPNTAVTTLFNSAQTPVALLSDKTAFDTLGTEPTWGTTNQVNGVWGSYTNGNRFRDIGFQWGNGTPAANTDFRSILFRKVTSGGALGGYQLLLDNQMTKASTATLALSLRFSL